MHPLAAIALYGAGAYVLDVVLRPAAVADLARTESMVRGKPLLNVGAGTPDSSLRVALLGPPVPDAVNVDVAGNGRNGAVYGDAHALPYPDKVFGAALASHVLEHCADPRRAIRELQRVADRVYVVWPSWWAPHTWLHPGHRWYRDGAGRLWRLWQ